MAGVPGYPDSGTGHRACPVHYAQPAPAGRGAERGCSDGHHHGLRQHHPGGPGSGVPRGRGNRTQVPGLAALERRGHGAPGPARRYRRRRAHLHLRRGRDPVRGRVQPLLPRQGPPRRRGPGLLPGPRLPRHVRPRLHGRPAVRGGPGRLPAGEVQGRPRPVLLPAPAPDAGVLGIPHGLDGHRADERDLPGPVEPVPAQPRHQGHLGPAGLGVPGRRRNGRARVPRAAPARRERQARQPELRDQLQPPAPRRTGARQRQDHAGTRGLLPRRRLERHQGGLGPGVG
ncbi:hypothetical protein SRABI26_04694 [Arthrobacter sp. Bi26]|nr:hypothetical protein SRABI26_04694 [Arthrobacter sp. Bi26]